MKHEVIFYTSRGKIPRISMKFIGVCSRSKLWHVVFGEPTQYASRIAGHETRLRRMKSHGISTRLQSCLMGGTAFHNANLHAAERRIVERYFRDPAGGIAALGATTTLAAGINTPASTVILAEQEFIGEDGDHSQSPNIRTWLGVRATSDTMTSCQRLWRISDRKDSNGPSTATARTCLVCRCQQWIDGGFESLER